VSSDEALDEAVASWRTTHHICEDDPMMAALDLVRVYFAHAPRPLPNSTEVRRAMENSARQWICWIAVLMLSASDRST
jgi:hypothetical protein